MVKKYAKPPIVEAVCEFRLTHDTRWDLTVPGLLYEKLKASFPQKEAGLPAAPDLQAGDRLALHLQRGARHLGRAGGASEEEEVPGLCSQEPA